MFTPGAANIIDLAKDIAMSAAADDDPLLTPTHVTNALVSLMPSAAWLADLLAMELTDLQWRYPLREGISNCANELRLSKDLRQVLVRTRDLATRHPVPKSPGLIAIGHLVCGIAEWISDEPECTELAAPNQLYDWLAAERSSQLALLDRRIRTLRQKLLSQVFGQDNAIHAFSEALFSVELVAEADRERHQPAGIFVFAGPPGVGKTYLAERAAEALARPFLRFDMSSYSQDHEVSSLVGSPPIYRGAEPGLLTRFVKKNQNAVLLFDEIEKAAPSAIHLFLQVLDAGRLQDRNTDETIGFRDTLIIFTTNVGRQLYEAEGKTRVTAIKGDFHRTTILEALRSEINPRTRSPYFPAAICSRLGSGHPILFWHLGINELAHVAASEIDRITTQLSETYGQMYHVTPEVILSLVLREGGDVDARTVKAQASRFLKEELFHVCGLIKDTRLPAVLAAIATVTVEVDPSEQSILAQELFQDDIPSGVLMAGDLTLGMVMEKRVSEVEWHLAGSAATALEVLARDEAEMVLLDLSLPGTELMGLSDITITQAFMARHEMGTEIAFDRAPLSARRFASGQELLNQLRRRRPDLPVYLLSLSDTSSTIDEETLAACLRVGGARGIVTLDTSVKDDPWAAFGKTIRELSRQCRKERIGRGLATRNQTVQFDIAPILENEGATLRLRCRNYRLATALKSGDANAMLSSVERPTTQFADVFGAVAAKQAMFFIRDWLRTPKKYAALGVDPPRAVLMTGPPGTGKTMLARALAGESECAFVSESATNFVTMWQGSGPENVRQLFARARRYAPTIVFIDEIDAVGRRRQGSPSGHGEEMALNALLMEMDGFGQSPDRPVIVIAATNLVDLLDPALRRRFSRVIEVELPTRLEREDYLTQRLAQRQRQAVSAETIRRLAAQGHGMSIANLEQILAEAAVMAVEHEGMIDDAILGEAFEKLSYGERRGAKDTLRTARHEAGHALVMCLTGDPPIYVTTVGRGSFGGYAAMEDRDRSGSMTRPELEDMLCRLLAGREAERLYYGEGAGDSTGPSSDLERATAIAESMVYDYGMAEEIGFVRIDRRQRLADSLAERCQAAVVELLRAAGERAALLLREHHTSLDDVVGALEALGRLNQEELLKLVASSTNEVAGNTGGTEASNDCGG